MIDIATGLSIDPPIACSMRNAISQPRPGARPPAPGPYGDTARPVWKTRRAAYWLAVAPESISRLASTRT